MADKTVTVRPSGGTYTTLAAAITGEVAANANLVTMAGILTISIEGDWSGGHDTTPVTVAGFTTSALYYVNIVTDAANRAGTIYDNAKYSLEAASPSGKGVIHLSNAYSRIKGLQVKDTGYNYGSFSAAADNFVIDSCLSYGSANDSIHILSGVNGVISNFVGRYNRGANGIHINIVAGGTIYLYNVTIVSSAGKGILMGTASTAVMKNCYSGGNVNADYDNGTGTMTMTDCYSEDGSESTTVAAYSTATFTNVTAGSEDVSLVTGSDLIGAGTDLSADATYPFDWDITGAERTSWDVGAAWFDAGGGGIVCAGIASTASIGTSAISATISASEIASTESIGSAALAATISASGIASAEAIGQPILSTTSGIVCAGIPSGEAFGTPGLSVAISAAGIASGGSFGAPALAANITTTGIASAQAMGTPSIAASIMAASIASAEAVGLPSIGVELFLAGIASAESFGHPSLYTGGGMGEVVAGGAWRKAVEAQTVVGGQWRTIAKVYAVIASEWTELS